MTENTHWRDGVRVVRGQSLDLAMRHPSTRGRATAIDFAGTGGRATWIGRVTLQALTSRQSNNRKPRFELGRVGRQVPARRRPKGPPRSLPNTPESLRRELSDLGLRPGMTVMVHSSLGNVGWTVGGPVTVIRALLDVLASAGTLVMPAESPQVSDPATWRDDRVEAERHDTLPAYLRVIFANADRLMIAEPQTAVDLLALDADSLALVTNHNHPQDLAALAATPSIRR